jgi:hypothetical protein
MVSTSPSTRNGPSIGPDSGLPLDHHDKLWRFDRSGDRTLIQPAAPFFKKTDGRDLKLLEFEGIVVALTLLET